jgi:RNA polymerase sigma-70 factor (ECF subfamily)
MFVWATPARNPSVKRAADPFERLYNENHRRVYELLARIVGPLEAEDLTQIVFAKAARALRGFRGDARASTWLYRIAARVASDWLGSRAAKEAKATVELPDAGEASEVAGSSEINLSPEQDLIRREMSDCIRGVIGQLPEKQRTVLMLGELAGLPDDEVAQTLGISLANAKVRLHRARSDLKKMLQKRCDFSRDDDNEFVCEPKPATCSASLNDASCSGESVQDGRTNSEAV